MPAAALTAYRQRLHSRQGTNATIMVSNPLDTTQRTLLSPGPLRPAPRSACVVVIHGEGLAGARTSATRRY